MTAVLRARYPFLAPSLTVDHLIVGGGVVGLAIAERLTLAFPHLSTFLIERHGQCGRETSSRNSEVIHAGAYYPNDSLKTLLCVQGRDLLYTRCRANAIPFRQVGKLITANTPSQIAYLDGLLKKTAQLREKGLDVPLEYLTGDQVRELEPDVSQEVKCALLSSKTGIVSSHALMEDLEKLIENSESGELVYGTMVVRIDRSEGEMTRGVKRDGSEEGWVVQSVTKNGEGEWGEPTSVLTKCLVNAAGLKCVHSLSLSSCSIRLLIPGDNHYSAHHVLNQIYPPEQRKQLHYAAGNYFSYRGPGTSNVKHLLYPSPDSSSFAGLGTHLTLNLQNEVRFGPDLDWLETPLKTVDGVVEDEMDFWERHLAAKDTRMAEGIREVRKYLPNVVEEGFTPDCTLISSLTWYLYASDY